MKNIVPIVEGLGDVDAVPVVLRRLLAERHAARWDVGISRPIRLPRGKVKKPGEVERAVQLAIHDREGTQAILVIMDLDDDILDDLTADVLSRASAAVELPVGVCFAVVEFEAWLLGAKESLRGQRGIRADAVRPADPEALRDAKGHLERNMVAGRRYVETADQAALAAVFDLEQAEATCPSFARFTAIVSGLVERIDLDLGQPPTGGIE